MIIVDLNQVMISQLMADIYSKRTKNKYDLIANEDFLRHMVLNKIRSLNVRFRAQYGQMIIASDDSRSWRKQYFPYYKAHRRKMRDDSDLDWPLIFQAFKRFRDEMEQYLQFPVVWLDNVEADDIIATLVLDLPNGNELTGSEKILILSGDKDFVQLQRFPFVEQYDPVRKRWITEKDPDQFLIDHIIKGDRGDGIPNMASADNVFVEGTRQKKITTKRLEQYQLAIKHQEFGTEEVKRNYDRNRMLIDLTNVPEQYRKAILDKYHQQLNKDKSKIFNYFVNKKLTNLLECIGDF